MPVFVNRLLDLKKIKLIGFDMDYTLVAYNTESFEGLTHNLAKNRLVDRKGYPEAVKGLEFDYNRAIMGLVIDRLNGNLLKLNCFGKVKVAYHGLENLDFRKQAALYKNHVIDLRGSDFRSLDTAFAISNGVLFSQLTQLKEEGVPLPEFPHLVDDLYQTIDDLHKDGTIKTELQKDFSPYVIQDSKVALMLERFIDFGKKLMIITNSDYHYTKELLEYALDPYWKKHKSWRDVFDLVITLAEKPLFFERPSSFLSVNPENGLLSNYTGSVTQGLYQGGCFSKLEEDLDLPGNEVLYLGDHIYGDVVSIKKRCDWRTALVLGDLENEIQALGKAAPVQKKISRLMDRIAFLEKEIYADDLLSPQKRSQNKQQKKALMDEWEDKNNQVSGLLHQLRKFFNPYWGEILRAGYEKSRYADQIERYACIYMTKVSDMNNHSPRSYFRPAHRQLPHEILENS